MLTADLYTRQAFRKRPSVVELWSNDDGSFSVNKSILTADLYTC